MAGEAQGTPVTWAKARLGGNILPGDVLILLDGTYTAGEVTIEGTAENHVIIRPLNPGMVTIDGGVINNSAYVDYYDINFSDSNTDRYYGTQGVYSPVGTNSFYGCLFSDQHASGLNWMGSGAGEVQESVFVNNGVYYPDNSGHGHSIYAYNTHGGARSIARNIFCTSLGRYALHLYSTSGAMRDFTVEDNITAGHPTHTGGGSGLFDFVYRQNIQYLGYMQMGRYGIAEDGIISDNVYFGVGSYWVNASWVNLTESGNTVYGGQPASRSGYTLEAQPETWVRVIPFTKSQRWAASVAIFNRDSASTVSVDFSGIANGDYKLRNAQNMAETWGFTNTGAAVSVPMTGWTAAARIGDLAPNHTFPKFGAFVVEVV